MTWIKTSLIAFSPLLIKKWVICAYLSEVLYLDCMRASWEKENLTPQTMLKTNWRNCELLWVSVEMHQLAYIERICMGSVSLDFFISPKQKAHFTGQGSRCWRLCGSHDASHWHMFWECSVISHFWSEIHKILENMFNSKIPYHFKTFILGKVDFHTGHFIEYLFGVLISAGKKTITRHWLTPDSPTIEEWTDIVDEIYAV